jgi:hypothetical protein
LLVFLIIKEKTMRSCTCEDAQGLFCEDGEGSMTQMLASCNYQAAMPKIRTEAALGCSKKY